MATFADLKTQVASDLKRSDLNSSISAEILNSVARHSNERFWFNETRAYTFSLTNAVDEYTLASSAPVLEFVKIDWVRVQIGSQWVRLRRIDADRMEELQATTASGQPTYAWSYYGNKLRFYPVPNATFTAKVAGHYRLIELSADTDSNSWTNEGKSLIRYTALTRLFAFPIRNADAAMGAAQMAQAELDDLRQETSRRKRKGYMEPYY